MLNSLFLFIAGKRLRIVGNLVIPDTSTYGGEQSVYNDKHS